MTETEQKERQEIEDSRGWRVLNETKDWLKSQMEINKPFSTAHSSCLTMYGKIIELERGTK